MAMFGTRKPAFGQIPGMGQMQPPMAQPQPQVGAMDPNTQAMTKKPGFFAQGQPGRQIIGVIGDTLATLGGGQGVYMPAMLHQQQQDAEIRARLQEAIAKRKAEREDKQWEWENKPKEAPNNDTVNDFNWYSQLTPEQRNLYHQMKPTIAFRADGTPIAVNPMQLGQPQPTSPPPEAVNELKNNPATAAQFDEIFGQGAAARVLGGPVQKAPVTFSGQ